MEIYGHQFSSLCVQVTMCHMTEKQQLGFKSGLQNFPVCLPLWSLHCSIKVKMIIKSKLLILKPYIYFLGPHNLPLFRHIGGPDPVKKKKMKKQKHFHGTKKKIMACINICLGSFLLPLVLFWVAVFVFRILLKLYWLYSSIKLLLLLLSVFLF